MEEFIITGKKCAFSEEELEQFEALPSEHQSRIFTALSNHFAKYNDLLKKDSSIPSKDDL